MTNLPTAVSTPLLLLLSAPSGAGKTTLGDGLLRQNDKLRRVITCTTRAPRPGERHGIDYHFLTPEDFGAKVEAGAFLEYATVYGRSYGTLVASVRELLASGHDALLTIDVQGAAAVRRRAAIEGTLRDSLITVFLTPASREELASRLRGRGTEAAEVFEARMSAAAGEIEQRRFFDYLIISDTREVDLLRAQAIYDAERLRQARSDFKWVT